MSKTFIQKIEKIAILFEFKNDDSSWPCTQVQTKNVWKSETVTQRKIDFFDGSTWIRARALKPEKINMNKKPPLGVAFSLEK